MQLFSEYWLRGLKLRNRVVVSPMAEYSSEDGFATDWHLVHLGSRAVGGAGLVFTEATAVTAEGRVSPQDLGIYRDEHIEMLARIARFIRQQGATAGIQLQHGGRKSSTRRPWDPPGGVPVSEGGWVPIAPSAVRFADGYPMPLALDEEGIRAAIQSFVDAAKRSLEAGFQTIEIHAAHGYLVHEFLSPLSNRRIDRYGGSFENRTRFARELIEAIRRVLPERYPLLIRISASDWTEGGWDIEQSIELAKIIAPLGIDLIDCSSGGNVPVAEIPVGPGYQVPFAEAIRKRAGIPTGAVGMITTGEQAEAILQQDQADLIIMAREFLRQPYWPFHVANQAGYAIPWPAQYLRAAPRGTPMRGEPADA